MCDVLKLKKKRKTKIWRPPPKISIAIKMHDCSRCCVPIFDGDQYERNITFVNGKPDIEKHHYPECPFDPDDERATRESDQLAEWNAMKPTQKQSFKIA
jgi:hypothetical protein